MHNYIPYLQTTHIPQPWHNMLVYEFRSSSMLDDERKLPFAQKNYMLQNVIHVLTMYTLPPVAQGTCHHCDKVSNCLWFSNEPKMMWWIHPSPRKQMKVGGKMLV